MNDEIDLKIESVEINAPIRKLTTTFTLEAMEDLKWVHGIVDGGVENPMYKKYWDALHRTEKKLKLSKIREM